MKQIILSKRVRSLVWRTLMMFIAGICAAIADDIGLLKLNGEMTVLVGLVLGEISKAINNMIQESK
jgi:hypothetical protein